MTNEKQALDACKNAGVQVRKLERNHFRKALMVGPHLVEWRREFGGSGCWKVDGSGYRYVGQAIVEALRLTLE